MNINKYLKDWDVVRIIRLVIAISVGIYGIITKDYPFVLLALFFVLQAIFNFSLCGAGGCATSTKQNSSKQKSFTDDIIKYKKH